MKGKYIVKQLGDDECFCYDTLEEAIEEAEECDFGDAEIFLVGSCKKFTGNIKWETADD